MKISLREHGGIAAAIRLGRAAKVLDSTILDKESAIELDRLLVAAKATPAAPSTSRPDEMSYTITIEDDGASVTLRASDSAMSREFEALLQWLQARLQ